MEEGRKKIRLCLLGIVLAALVTGLLYHYFGQNKVSPSNEGTLVKRIEVEYYGS